MKKFIAFILTMLLFSIPLTANAKGDIYEIATKHTYKNDNTVLPYRLILPDNYDDNKTYPLIFFFHGAGERGNDNELQFFHLVQYIYDNAPEDCIIVAPQCPLNNQWVDTPWANGAYSVDSVRESNEMAAVIELLDNLEAKYSVDEDRIYAIGLSMGGFATWDILMRHNDIIAAGIPICGGGDPKKAEVLKDTPIFTFHAVNDTSVPYQGTKQTVDAIKAIGGDKIEYTQYTTGGHGIWNQAIQTPNLLNKLFKCKLSDRMGNEDNNTSTEESKPVESTPDESKPVESTPDESTPDESTPEESKPVESTPDESTTVESTPVESTPDESVENNVSNESTSNESDATVAEDNGFWNAKTLTLAISIVVAGIITVILSLIKKKKKA